MGVTGIGGFFFRADDPVALARWYKDVLGIDAGHDAIWNQQAGMTVFAPFKRDSDYFAADRAFMLNLRVEDLDSLLEKIRGAGVEVRIDPSWDEAGYGRFARIHDPDGNPIELWEPAADD